MKNWLLVLLAVALLCTGCEKAKVDTAKEEAAIRAVDAQWQEAVKARDVEKIVSFWADDAVVFPAGGPAIRGKAAIREYVKGALSSPDFNITWQLDSVSVAAAGDLAYETAHDEITFRSPAGQLMKEQTNAVVVWKKQSDGSWKAVIDIWTPTAPPKQ